MNLTSHIDASVSVTPVTDEELSRRYPVRGNAFYYVVIRTSPALLPSRDKPVFVILARSGCRRFQTSVSNYKATATPCEAFSLQLKFPSKRTK